MISKRGFTLFEILIVTLLIGIIYSIFIVTIRPSKKDSVNIYNFKTYLKKKQLKTNFTKAELLCLRIEKFCRIYFYGDKKEKYEKIHLFHKNEELIVYDMKLNDEINVIEFGELNDDEYDLAKEITLKIVFFENLSSKPYIVDDGSKIVYFSSYSRIHIYEDKNVAIDKILNNKEIFLDFYKKRLNQ